MKGDIYCLRDPSGHIVGKFEQTSDYMDGHCYECNEWGGEPDYMTPSGWSFFFLGHVRLICFVWKIAEEILVEYNEKEGIGTGDYTHEEYSGNEKLKHLVDFMLEGYSIEKEKKNDQT